MENIVRNTCFGYQLPESRIDTIMKKLTKSLHTDYENGWITAVKFAFICEYMNDYDDDEI